MRRLLPILLVLAVAGCCTGIVGDVNCDGCVTVLDLIIVRGHVLDGTWSWRADVNKDLVVDEADMEIVRDIILEGGF